MPLLAAVLLLLTPPTALPAQEPTLPQHARTLIAEALSLADDLREATWPQWTDTGIPILLVTPEHEFLIRHPTPSSDFERAGRDSLLRSDIYVRPREFPPNLLASFPAVSGIPTIVIGLPEATDRSSTMWVLTLLHEHFHQLQMSHPDYYRRVAALDLADGDDTGMWMVNYRFPYDSAVVQQRFHAMLDALLEAVESEDAALPAKLATFLSTRDAFRETLIEPDYRYISFQLWQEGVARYTEYQVALLAAERGYSPSDAFRALPDFIDFREAADSLHRGIFEGARASRLGEHRRVAFYPAGALMALLLDRAAPAWKERYFTDMLQLDSLLTGAASGRLGEGRP